MKLNTALAKSLLIGASLGFVGSLCAQTTTTAPAPGAAKSAAKGAPGKTDTPAKSQPTAEAKADTPEEIILPGVVQPRPNGGFLTVEVVDGKFKLSFYDAKKKQVPADVARATARWRSNRKTSEDRSVLNPDGDGKSLVGVGFVRPPFIFKVYLTLLNEEGTASESHVIDLNPSVRAGGTDAEAERE